MQSQVRASVALATFSIAVFSASSASADVPPPDDYVERCTIEIAKRDGEECVGRSSWHGDKGEAASYLGNLGFCRRCRTHGASVWSEVHCRKADPSKPLPANWEQEVAEAEKAAPEDGERKSGPQCEMTDAEAASRDPRGPRSGCACAIGEEGPGAAAGAFGLLLGLAFSVRRAVAAARSRR